jgi:tripartite-type tricarboxylate transporter receptor subunit TctC
VTRTKLFRWIAPAIALGALISAAPAQEYPAKPIRLIAPGIGNSFDTASRHLAPVLGAAMGQSVIVDNRPPGVIPGQVVLQAPADGYTLLWSGSSLWLGQYIQASTPYEVRDFAPVTLGTLSPTVLVIHPSLPVKSVRDLIALAKSKPGELNCASGAPGAINHLTAELFKSMAHVEYARIPYKGSGPALIDLMAGRVQMMFSVTGSVTPHLKSGKLRGLAVTSMRPSDLAPGLPTVAASGVPGFESVSNAGVFVSAKTPRPIVDRLHREIVTALARPDMKQKLLDSGMEPVGSTPEAFAKTIEDEMNRFGKLIKSLGIKEQ